MLIVFDCDGVLTDRGLLYDQAGNRILRFDARDGFGIALWCRSGLQASILSGRPIDVAAKRFAELGMTHLEGSCHDKRKGLEALCTASSRTKTSVGDIITEMNRSPYHFGMELDAYLQYSTILNFDDQVLDLTPRIFAKTHEKYLTV